MKSIRLMFSFLFLIMFSTTYLAQDLFVRSAVIQPPVAETGGFGNVVTGVDFDGDGKLEIYAVNNNINDTPSEVIPRIYKYEFNGTSWDSVWSTILVGVEKQNTWPALTYGDWDNDGKKEIIWGPVNFTVSGTNENPSRIVVFESKGDGSDVMGVDNGDGTFKPNAQWNMGVATMYNLRPIRWFLQDIDDDGQQEITFCSRVAGERFGIVSVSTIPDNGDGSEVWTMEASGLGMTNIDASTIYDIAILDNVIYLFSQNGTISTIKRVAGVWTDMPKQINAAPGGSWLSANVVDIDNNGSKEIIFGSFLASTDNHVYVLQKEADTLKAYPVADLATGGRIYSSDYGDVDGDGNLDFVFGTRDGVPDAGIYRAEYQGGSITDPTNWVTDMIDSGYPLPANRWGIISVGNMNGDDNDEVLYSSSYGTPTPLIILNHVPIANATPIVTVKVDANGDFQPDNLGQTFTVIGTVSSINFTASANAFSYYIQDNDAGIDIFKGGVSGGGPVYNIGDRLLVTGTVAQYRGLTELVINDLAADIILLDTGNPVTPVDVTIKQYLTNGELYEGRYIQLKGVGLAPTSAAWPAGANASITVWDGMNKLTMFVDKDTDLDENTAPVFPINVKGIASQYSSGSTVYNDGYQITPNYYADITPNAPAPPSPYFSLIEPANNATIPVVNNTDSFLMKWHKALDFNNDNLIYQFVALPNLVTSTALTDTMYNLTSAKVLQLMGANPDITFRWTVKTKGSEATLVSSVDTFTVTFTNNIVTVEDTMFLTHVSGNMEASIFNFGAIGADYKAAGPGISWKGQNGLYLGGLMYGTQERASVNGIIGSFRVSDMTNLSSNFAGGFTSNASFNQITNAVITDEAAVTPYNVNVIQQSFSNTDEGILYIRYGFINKSAAALNNFYSGIFIDWDIDVNNYATNKVGYDAEKHMIYQYDGTSPYYYGMVALNGVSGYKGYVDGALATIRAESFGFISTLEAVAPTAPGDYRCWIGSKIGDIAVNDTMWVTFAIVAGDELINVKQSAGNAFIKAKTLGWTEIVVGVEDNNELSVVPSQFYVEQNYPNPFNPSTSIRFGLPQASTVDLRIYNILGQEVAVLINGQNLSAGTYNHSFDASSLSSGTYIYRLQSGSNVVTKKMMLIK
ncbi:MAG: FG-GAP-like repeat-containing protein [bacterium]